MIPSFIDLPGSPWPVLPAGIHIADLREVEKRFATNPGRRLLFKGLVIALQGLKGAGCQRVFLDGSYVTAKPHPGDFDACWDPKGVDRYKIDPVLLNFDDQRAAQKKKFKGEFFPSSLPADRVGNTFIMFFQIDRFTGDPKGIVSIDLTTDAMLQSMVTS